eukprot:TRINITY_DN8608_c0_g1_i2.p1 TRINITY_DN8608_c0_g1~~TRINITY_DN8608_c0_g1_i2.p1  ORF type:complete len:617 (-),score=162.62 TRINITY_DN8608_c0_g1_i2:224-2011(-)
MPNARGVCGDAECGGAADKVEPSARGNLGGAHIDNRFFVRGNGMKDLPSDSNVLNTMQEMLQDLGDRQRRAEERLSEQIARVGVKLDEAMCKTHCGWRDCPEIPLQAKALDHLLEVAPVSANPSARSHGKKEKEKHQNNGTEASDSTKAPNNRCTSASVWSQKKPNGEEGDEHEPKEKGKSDIKKRRTSVAKVLEDIAASAPGAPPAAPTLPESHTLLERLVRNPKFDMGIASVVMVNSILIGLKIDEEALGVEPYDGYTYIEYCCSAVFAMELFVRLIVNQKYFLCGPQKYWAFFDCILVAMSIFEVILVVSIGGAKGLGNAAPMAKALKIARMARIFRIFRMCRFLTKIRLMAAMIVGTLSSLIWLFILCVGIMYVFAIIMTQGAADVIHTDEWGFAREEKEAIEGEFGSLARSMYTLFKGMTGGVSWGEPGAVAMKLGDIYFFVYVVFISFVFFSVLNIVTGVFVDDAIQCANKDRTVAMQKAKDQAAEHTAWLTEILVAIDVDDSGYISLQEWEDAMANQCVKDAMAALAISSRECEELWGLLDLNNDGVIAIQEFIQGMREMNEACTRIDISLVIMMLKSIAERLNIKHF